MHKIKRKDREIAKQDAVISEFIKINPSAAHCLYHRLWHVEKSSCLRQFCDRCGSRDENRITPHSDDDRTDDGDRCAAGIRISGSDRTSAGTGSGRQPLSGLSVSDCDFEIIFVERCDRIAAGRLPKIWAGLAHRSDCFADDVEHGDNFLHNECLFSECKCSEDTAYASGCTICDRMRDWGERRAGRMDVRVIRKKDGYNAEIFRKIC